MLPIIINTTNTTFLIYITPNHDQSRDKYIYMYAAINLTRSNHVRMGIKKYLLV